jgi:hypothetical protein
MFDSSIHECRSSATRSWTVFLALGTTLTTLLRYFMALLDGHIFISGGANFYVTKLYVRTTTVLL